MNTVNKGDQYMVTLERSLGIHMTRRTLMGMTVASAASIAFARSGVLAADDTPEQKKLAKKSVLQNGADWLQYQRLPDGSFPLSGSGPSVLASAEALHALVALQNVDVEVDLGPTVEFLTSNPEPNEIESHLSYFEAETALALAEAGVDPRDVGGKNLVQPIIDSWDPTTGWYKSEPIASFYSIALFALIDEKIPPEAIATLTSGKRDDGSFAYFAGTDSLGDSVSTAAVIQALAATGHGDDPAIGTAIDYLHLSRDTSGGVATYPGSPSDAVTTALAVMALTAAGERRTGDKWKPTIDALIAFQNESGGFRYTADQPEDDPIATATALVALAGASLPVQPSAS
jgi:hypothetical protein